MAEETEFAALIQRVRSGDAEAATELVRRYEPEVRRLVRVRLTSPRLGRVIDTADICQSVLANFFVRVTAGQFELENPEQLLKLLVTMARNKLLDHLRKQRADRRDDRRLQASSPAALATLPDGGASPSELVARQDVLEQVRQRLSDEERALMESRMQGRDWAAIAVEQRGSAEALRKKLTRALDRLAGELGLREAD